MPTLMKTLLVKCVMLLSLSFGLMSTSFAQTETAKNTQIIMETSKGTITLELFDDKAPTTVKNFLSYVNEGFFTNTLFHRVIPNFMIQGGGFNEDLTRKSTKAPIINEAAPNVPNIRGTIAMARTNNPNSATSQFFINVVDNLFLNKSLRNPGYAVFGKVIEGMEVADQIAGVKTTRRAGMADVPEKAIIIKKVTVKQAK